MPPRSSISTGFDTTSGTINTFDIFVLAENWNTSWYPLDDPQQLMGQGGGELLGAAMQMDGALGAEPMVELFGGVRQMSWEESLLLVGLYDEVMTFLAEHPEYAR